MKDFRCGRYVISGFIAGLVAWTIFIVTLIYASLYVPDVRTYPNQLFSQRSGIQTVGFIAGWWLAIVGLALCGIGYVREYKGLNCLMGVVPSALYVANPWAVVVLVRITGG